MVKIKNVFGDEYKGKQGNAVYQKFYGRQVRRLWDGRKKNAAPQQEEQKNRFRVGLAFWSSLDKEEREFLRGYVTAHYPALTPQQWAVKVALTRPRAVLQAEQVKANVLEWRQGWDAIGWPYRQEVTIKNNTSDDLNDFQVKLELTSDSVGEHFDWSRKGADLRFYDSDGNKLNYYVETWDEAGKQATVWVKVPSIPTSGSTSIKMYYGSADAESESNGKEVFDFFDDFDSDTEWTLIGVNSEKSYTIENGELHLNYLNSNVGGLDEAVYKSMDVSKCTIEAKMKIRSDESKGIVGLYLWKTDPPDTGAHALGFGGEDNGTFGVVDWNFDGSGVTVLNEWDPDWLNWHVWTVKKDGNSYKTFYDYTEKYSFTRSSTATNYIGFGAAYKGNELWVDWVRVRKYAEPEPSASLGEEEDGRYYVEGVKTIYVKAVEHVAIKKVELYDQDGQLLGTWDDLSNLDDGRIMTIWRIPDDVADKVSKAVVYSLAGTVDKVNF